MQIHKRILPEMTIAMIKVLHIFGCMNLGGAEICTVEWMKAIHRDKYQFHFCSLSGKRGVLDETIERLGGKVFYCDLSPGFTKRFLQLLSSEKYDIVHSHVYYFSGYILLWAYRKKIVGRIAYFHSSASYQKVKLYKRLYIFIMKKMIKRYATHVCGVSRKGLDSIWEKHEQDQRFFVNYNGFCNNVNKDRDYVKRHFSLNACCKIVIHVGNLRKEKNHKRLLQIFAQMHKENDRLKLLIVGKEDSSILQNLHKYIMQNNLQNDVIFTGVRNDVRSLLGGSDLLLFPSLQEGLPGVVIEACSMTTPVLASDVGGIPEIAKFFPHLVTNMSLHDSNDLWCKTAIAILEKRHTASIKFEETPFYLPQSLRNVLKMYDIAGKNS